MKSIKLPALLAALALGISVPIIAQADHHGDKSRKGKMMEKLDTNADGAISKAEAEAAQAAKFAEIDANGDGALTQAEMEDHREAKRAERKAARFAKADADGNGTISIDEFNPRAMKRFERMDADDNGVISAEEHEAHAGKKGRRGKHKRGMRGHDAPPATE